MRRLGRTVLLVAALALLAIAAGTVPVAGQSDGPAEVDVEDLPGEGTEENPYEISNVSELQAMEQDMLASYELVDDIDASATATWNDGAGFDPIGNFSWRYQGLFDGNGHTISGLEIDRDTRAYVGIFGGNAGLVRDVRLEDARITGRSSVGTIVGYNRGDVQNVSASGEVFANGSRVGGLIGSHGGGALVSQSEASVTVDTNDIWAGGLAGIATGTVRESHATGDVTADRYLGGLAGVNRGGPIVDSYATGTVTGDSVRFGDQVGGLVGKNRDRIVNSYATGTVHGDGETAGLVGRNLGTVEDSYATGDVIAEGWQTGGLVGLNWDGTIENSHASGLVDAEYVGGGLVGDNSGGTVVSSTASGRVTLRSFRGGGLAGQNGGTIRNASATGSVSASHTVGGLVGINEEAGDVERSSAEGSVSGDHSKVGGLVGTNHGSIVDASAGGPVEARTWSGGLVGYQNGTVENATAAGDVSGDRSLGGLVGINNGGSIVRTSSTGDVTAEAGSVGDEEIGGLVGTNEATIRESYATGTVSGPVTAGGLVGFNDNGSIQDVAATGSVSGDTAIGGLVGLNNGSVRSAYATGNVAGNAETGGLVASEASLGAVRAGYWDTQATGQDSSMGGTGLSTADMTGNSASSSMSGLDFATTWTTVEDSYPIQDWQREELRITSLDPASVTASPGESITVSASVEKPTGEERTHTVEFSLGGSTVQTEAVRIAGGQSTTVEFTLDTALVDRRSSFAVETARDRSTGYVIVAGGSGVSCAYTDEDGYLTSSGLFTAINDFNQGDLTAGQMFGLIEAFENEERLEDLPGICGS